jgi:hypothetical protein
MPSVDEKVNKAAELAQQEVVYQIFSNSVYLSRIRYFLDDIEMESAFWGEYLWAKEGISSGEILIPIE